jgi:hypothetical protein
MKKYLTDRRLQVFAAAAALLIVLVLAVVARPQQAAQQPQNLPAAEAAFIDVIAELRSWTGDYQIQGCSASKDLASWTCNVFSKEKKQVRIAIWNSGDVTLSTPVTMNNQYISAISKKPAFNELEKAISSEKALAIAKEAGLNSDENDAYLFIGESTINQYGAQYVWYIEERSKTKKDEDGVFELISKYYIDAYEGKLLEK